MVHRMIQSSLKLTYLVSEILRADPVLQIFVPYCGKRMQCFSHAHVSAASLHAVPLLHLPLTPNQKEVGCFLCFPFVFLWLGFLLSPYFAPFFSNLDSLKHKWKLMVVSKLSNILDSFAWNNCLFLFISSQCLKNNNTSSPLNLWTFPGYRLVS